MQEKKGALLGSVKAFAVFEIILGAALGILLWPLCATAFKGPFESPGYLIVWPLAVIVSFSPVFLFISGTMLLARKKAGIFFLFLGLAILLVACTLASLFLYFVVPMPSQAWIRMLAYGAVSTVLILIVFSAWFFSRSHVRAMFQVAKKTP